MAKARGLGRGLESLIPATPQRETPPRAAIAGDSSGAWELDVARIRPSRWQPRRAFDPERLQDLANSIRDHGLISPLVVRELKSGEYELIAGERRLRAIRDVLGNTKVPVRLMNAEDAKMRELALVENLQRDDLNPIEEAVAYHELRKELGLTHEAIADRLKVSRPKITNTMRLLELPEEIKGMVMDGRLAPGTARALLSLPNPVAQIKLAHRAVAEDLSTRRVEQLTAEKNKPAAKPEERKRPSHVEALEERLRLYFSSKVRIEDDEGKGRIILEYYSVDDAQRLLNRMGLPPEEQ